MTHPSHFRSTTLSLGFTLLLLVLLLAGCGGTAETDLTLYAGERWESTTHLEFPSAALSFAGGAGAIEQQFDELVSEQAANGIKLTYKEEKAGSPDMMAYVVKMTGDSYASLEAMDMTAQPNILEGKDAWTISYASSDSLSGIDETIRIHVGSIIQSESAQLDDDTLVGGTNAPVYAVIIPKSRFNPWIVIGPLLAVAAIGAVVLVNRRKEQVPTSASVATPPSFAPSESVAPEDTVECPNCGKPTLSWSKFCMNCGAQVPPTEPQS